MIGMLSTTPARGRRPVPRAPVLNRIVDPGVGARRRSGSTRTVSIELSTQWSTPSRRTSTVPCEWIGPVRSSRIAPEPRRASKPSPASSAYSAARRRPARAARAVRGYDAKNASGGPFGIGSGSCRPRGGCASRRCRTAPRGTTPRTRRPGRRRRARAAAGEPEPLQHGLGRGRVEHAGRVDRSVVTDPAGYGGSRDHGRLET